MIDKAQQDKWQRSDQNHYILTIFTNDQMIFSQYFAFYERNHFLIEAFQKLQGCSTIVRATKFILRFISLKQEDKMYLLMIRSIITNRFK